MMNRGLNVTVHRLALSAAVFGLTSTALAGVVGDALHQKAAATGRNSGVLPVQSDAFGMSYGEWSARFWQWEFSLSVDHHPLFDKADCSAGQSGKVWFLGGTFSTTPGPPGTTVGKAERSCTVPPGTALFFPIVNVECSAIEGDHTGFGTTSAELQKCAQFLANFINPNTLRATIDGVELTALNQYRVQSPPFMFGPLPDNNIFQFFSLSAPAGTKWPSASDGVHLLLHPLSAGAHTIQFFGEIDFEDGSKFIQDITYHLLVAH